MDCVNGKLVKCHPKEVIALQDVEKPDFGDSPNLDSKMEVPVFWACGVTPQAAVMDAKIPFCITHKPGHMLVMDQLDAELEGVTVTEESVGVRGLLDLPIRVNGDSKAKNGANGTSTAAANIASVEKIDEIILDGDVRGMQCLRNQLPSAMCGEVAEHVLALSPGRVGIVTGFHIHSAGAAETDGPPGAVAFGEALQLLGWDVTYITDQWSETVVRGSIKADDELIVFPSGLSDEEARACAHGILLSLNPKLMISVERCGRCADGKYRNMVGEDIYHCTETLDMLFEMRNGKGNGERLDFATIGIGDGGNEVGMGNVKWALGSDKPHEKLPDHPCKVKTDYLVSISSTRLPRLVASVDNLDVDENTIKLHAIKL